MAAAIGRMEYSRSAELSRRTTCRAWPQGAFCQFAEFAVDLRRGVEAAATIDNDEPQSLNEWA